MKKGQAWWELKQLRTIASEAIKSGHRKSAHPVSFVILTFLEGITRGISSKYVQDEIKIKYFMDSTSLELHLHHPMIPSLGAVEYG
jgi:hypothetical protein